MSGLLALLALLKKIKLSYIEILLLGIPLGMTFRAFFESLVGIQYFSILPLINASVIFHCITFSNTQTKNQKFPTEIKIDRKTAITYAILLIITFLAFWTPAGSYIQNKRIGSRALVIIYE